MQITVGDEDSDQIDVMGERRLHLAVLVTAIEDLTSPNRLDRSNAISWFDNCDAPISFQHCRELFDLNAQRLAHIFSIIQSPPKEFKKMNLKKCRV